MPTCPQCGTTEPGDAQWCGRCYLPFAPTPSAAGVREVALPGAAAPSPPPVVPPPMPGPPPAPVMAPAPPAPVMAPPVQMAPPTQVAPPVQVGSPQELGWEPPSGAAPWMPAPAGGPAVAIDDGRLFSGRAIALVATCIGLGILMQFFAYEISRDSTRNVDSQIRWDIVLTVLQYAVVAGIVLSQITTKIKLRWGPGPPIGRVALGAAVGLGGGGLILLALHASTGTLTSDSRVVLLMSGGEMTRIIAAAVLTCVAAPLVEEVLFRGLLLESLRRHHAAMALIVSAMFFAVWHLNRQGLIYYTGMGCVFGGLYLKRGLVASMTAHFCFNGALTVAAIYLVLGPSHTYTVDSLKVTVAAGWTDETAQTSGYFNSGSALYLQGPDASVIAVMPITAGPLAGQGFDADTFMQRLSSTPVQLPGGTYDANSVHAIDLPTVGTAVEINFSLNQYTAYKGEYVFFGADNETYMAMLVNGGSPKAETDFTTMLNSLEPAAPTGLPVS